MKYIVWEQTGEFPSVVMFSRKLRHSTIAKSLDLFDDKTSILGAGFVRLEKTGVRCTGYSATLDATSRGLADEEVIDVDFSIG